MSNLQPYIDPIFQACLLFLPIAGIFTLPFMVIQYRKYGSIPVLRVLVVYSFILYMMCAFLLTVLPLPSRGSVAAMTGPWVQLVPFSSYVNAVVGSGYSIKTLLHSSGLFEILANIVMQIPLGIYLRYYFRCSLKKTLAIGFCVSLFYELTQLSGLYFLYPRPYRLFSVDDLFDNTLGAVLGYGITPLICFILPSREELDALSISKGQRATMLRRITAAAVDWILYGIAAVLYCCFGHDIGRSLFFVMFCGEWIWILLVNVLMQRMCKGRTPGKLLLRIRVVTHDTKETPHIGQLIVRYASIYILFPLMLIVFISAMLAFCALGLYMDGLAQVAWLTAAMTLLLVVSVMLYRYVRKHHEFPHSSWSNTTIVPVHPNNTEEA